MTETGGSAQDEVYKLKYGQKEYDNLYHAITIAEAKAEDEDEEIILCRKLLNRFEPVLKIYPDGSQERLTDESGTH